MNNSLITPKYSGINIDAEIKILHIFLLITSKYVGNTIIAKIGFAKAIVRKLIALQKLFLEHIE
jgi:hypothetical protein